jgi:hypothetical protein
VEFVDFPQMAIVGDEMTGFVDEGLKTEREEVLRGFHQDGKFDLGSRNAFGFAFDGHEGLFAADSHPHGALGITRKIALGDAETLGDAHALALGGEEEFAFDLGGHGEIGVSLRCASRLHDL